ISCGRSSVEVRAMLEKGLGDDSDASTHPKGDRRLRLGAGVASEATIEFTQLRDCGRAVSLRQCRECSGDLFASPKAGRQAAKLNDLVADRQCRQQSRALQWLGLIRHRGEPTDHATAPIL